MECPFPIGSIFITVDSKNPSSIRAGTAREPFWKWRAIVCVNDESSAARLKTAWQTGWSWAWTTKTINQWDWWSATVISEQSTNYQPSITAYIWKRIDSTDNYNPFNIDTTQDGWKQLLNPYVIQVWDSTLDTPVPKMPNPYQPGN